MQAVNPGQQQSSSPRGCLPRRDTPLPGSPRGWGGGPSTPVLPLSPFTAASCSPAPHLGWGRRRVPRCPSPLLCAGTPARAVCPRHLPAGCRTPGLANPQLHRRPPQLRHCCHRQRQCHRHRAWGTRIPGRGQRDPSPTAGIPLPARGCCPHGTCHRLVAWRQVARGWLSPARPWQEPGAGAELGGSPASC